MTEPPEIARDKSRQPRDRKRSVLGFDNSHRVLALPLLPVKKMRETGFGSPLRNVSQSHRRFASETQGNLEFLWGRVSASRAAEPGSPSGSRLKNQEFMNRAA